MDPTRSVSVLCTLYIVQIWFMTSAQSVNHGTACRDYIGERKVNIFICITDFHTHIETKKRIIKG